MKPKAFLITPSVACPAAMRTDFIFDESELERVAVDGRRAIELPDRQRNRGDKDFVRLRVQHRGDDDFQGARGADRIATTNIRLFFTASLYTQLIINSGWKLPPMRQAESYQ